MMDWVIGSELVGAVFAFASIVLSVYILAKVKRGTSAWIYLGITSFCMFFAMLLGIAGTMFPVNEQIQRFEQYMFLLAGALSFALSGIKLQEMSVYKER